MNPFSNFNHFIAFFLPGIMLGATALALLSLFVGHDLLALTISGLFAQTSLLVLVLGAFFGLLVDEVRHAWIEENWLEERWARNPERRYDLGAMAEDFICYVSSPNPPVTLNAYLAMVDQYFHFYEFDVNTAIVLVPAALVAPFYLDHYYLSWKCHPIFILGFSTILLAIARLFWVFGVNAYEYFLDAFVDAMERGQPGFRASIQRQPDG